MFLKSLFFLFISSNLFACSLEETYYVKSNDINVSIILRDIQEDKTLFSIDNNRYTKRVKAKEIIKILDEYGYTCEASSRYIKFIKESPIDTTRMKLSLKKMYENSYPEIQIEKISIMPRSYIKSLTDNYSVTIKEKNNLSKEGIIYVKTEDNKKIFFDYTIDAKVNVYFTKVDINKGTRLSRLNTTEKVVTLEKFRDMPLQGMDFDLVQSKHNIKKEKIITLRDIEKLDVVKRGSNVAVNLDNNGILISFSAESLQNGKLNDIITVKKSDGKRFKVKVVGINRVELIDR